MGVEDRSDGRTVQLKRIRLSFTDSLKEASATVEDGPKKHTCNMILESGGDTFDMNKKKVIAALKSAGEKAWKHEGAWKDLWDDDPKRCCFRKGARFKNKEGQVYAGYDDNIAISGAGPSGGKKRPKMLDRHKRPVEEADILDVCYSGSYADVIISFYGTDKGGSRGIFCSIDAIRSHQEGDAQGGGGIVVEADDFDDLDDDDSFGGGADSSGDDDDLLG